ncbi:unnamed protein product [Vicia faba]|uniref:Uncharacterized protein n=1 Tax=Vicia faba TaxID=3906 RepID=A0AAV1AD51_VICFA|nr:unnamed protein product [Vicia faba]
MGKVFKGRNYPNSPLSDATVGYSPSFTWRSILSAKDVVSKGMRWRIRNGEQVQMWYDSWLPHNFGFKPVISIPNSGPDARVKELIDEDLGAWIMEKVETLFCPMEEKNIEYSLVSEAS